MDANAIDYQDLIETWYPGLLSVAFKYWVSIPGYAKPFYSAQDFAHDLVIGAYKDMKKFDKSKAKAGTFLMFCANYRALSILKYWSAACRFSAPAEEITERVSNLTVVSESRFLQAKTTVEEFLARLPANALIAVNEVLAGRRGCRLNRHITAIRKAAEESGLQRHELELCLKLV